MRSPPGPGKETRLQIIYHPPAVEGSLPSRRQDDGKMQLGGDERCRLLFVVYPIFVEALPTVSAPSCQPSQFADGPIPGETTLSRDNFITELRDEIKKIGINFNEEDALCELQKEVFQDAVIALDQILFLFEDLVHERLGNLVHDSLANVIPNDSKNEVRPQTAASSSVQHGC